MNRIVLTGLNESYFPISAMAAFGLLRVLTLSDSAGDSEGAPRLSWERSPRWTAVLHTRAGREEVVQAVVEAAAKVQDHPVWGAADDLRKDVDPSSFRQWLEGCAGRSPDEELTAGLAAEWPVSRDGRLVVTPFYMISGQQKFFDTVRTAADLGQGQDPGAEEAVEEALFGPWRYRDQLSAMGWDPATERYYALEAQAPTKSRPRAVRVAVWLAAESLALFPCFGVGRRVETAAVSKMTFYWPVWERPITYVALRTLLSLPLHRPEDRRDLAARGISAVFFSQRGTGAAGHGYYSFRPASLLWTA